MFEYHADRVKKVYQKKTSQVDVESVKGSDGRRLLCYSHGDVRVRSEQLVSFKPTSLVKRLGNRGARLGNSDAIVSRPEHLKSFHQYRSDLYADFRELEIILEEII